MPSLQPHNLPVPESFQEACAECGEVTHRRQYTHVGGRHTCEHCLLTARKRQGGLEGDPYELFVEALAEAMDLREQETGLHSKRVATHTLLLARHHFSKLDDLREVYWGSLLHDIGSGIDTDYLCRGNDPREIRGNCAWPSAHIKNPEPRFQRRQQVGRGVLYGSPGV